MNKNEKIRNIGYGIGQKPNMTSKYIRSKYDNTFRIDYSFTNISMTM